MSGFNEVSSVYNLHMEKQVKAVGQALGSRHAHLEGKLMTCCYQVLLCGRNSQEILLTLLLSAGWYCHKAE